MDGGLAAEMRGSRAHASSDMAARGHTLAATWLRSASCESSRGQWRQPAAGGRQSAWHVCEDGYVHAGLHPRAHYCLIVLLLAVIFWSCLLLYGAYRFFKWTELLSTWKGVAFLAAGLVLVTAIMHIFVTFSQAERCSSARAARNRAKKD